MPGMKAVRFSTYIVGTLLLFLTLPANAAKLGLGVVGGYGRYTMDDINGRTVNSINSTLERDGFPDRMDEIRNGSSFGGGLRLAVSSRIVGAVDYEHLAASTSVTAGAASVGISVPARAISATLTYLFVPATRFGCGLQAGVGSYTSDGIFTVDGVPEPTTSTIHGSGIGYRFGLLLNVPTGRSSRFSLSGGWRHARTTGLDEDGRSLTINGENATLDWSGVVIQGGLDLYLGKLPE